MEGLIASCHSCYLEHFVNKEQKRIFKCSYCGTTNLICTDDSCLVLENADEFNIDYNPVKNVSRGGLSTWIILLVCFFMPVVLLFFALEKIVEKADSRTTKETNYGKENKSVKKTSD